MPYLYEINYFTEENVNIQDNNGLTAFHYVCLKNFTEILHYLNNINYFTEENVNIEDNNGVHLFIT